MYLYAGAKFAYEEALLRKAFCFFEEVPRFPVTRTYVIPTYLRIYQNCGWRATLFLLWGPNTVSLLGVLEKQVFYLKR